MNPNAPRFNPASASFTPGQAFVPSQILQRPQQQQAPPPQSSNVQDSWDEPEPASAPQAQQSQPAKTVTLDTGSSEPKTVSLSIGGSSSKPAPSSKSAPKSQQVQQTAASETAGKSSKPSSGTSTPNQNSSHDANASAAAGAEAIAKEAAAVADQEALDDLYGADAGHEKMHVNIVFIGHVDAGKSTMGGNLLYLSGMVDQRTMEKYERESKAAGRESWALSWALDSTIQERDKGITVEVGRAFFETSSRRYTILDAPGHKNFVPNMISGAAQADIALLVISARKGEFETGFEKGGQTREHAMLVRTAGVQRLIVVVNKMDDPTVQWSQERYKEIVDKMTPFIRTTGFSNKMVTYIPVSAFTGANLKEAVGKKACPWHSGPPLLTLLDDIPLTDRDVHAPLTMPVSEKYADMGTMVVGKIETGRLRKGSELMLMPNKVPVEVMAIFNEMEEEVPSGIAGDNVRVRIRGVDEKDVSVGFVLSDAKKPCHAVTQFQAQLAILDHKNIICAGYSAVLHVHTASEEVSLSALLHYYDKKTGRKSKKPPQFAKKGQKIVALVETSAPICVEKFEERPALGRFTLRDEGKTVAIGKITKLVESNQDLQNMANLNINSSASAAAL